MRIWIHLGLDSLVTERIQRVMSDKRDQMIAKGFLFSQTASATVCQAVKDLDQNEPMSPEQQCALRDRLSADLAREIEIHKPKALILSDSRLGHTLCKGSELERLKSLLSPICGDIRIVAQVDEQASAFARHYGQQVMTGRSTPLDRELALADSGNWWQSCIDTTDQEADTSVPSGAPFWLDYAALVRFWESSFGPESVTLHPLNEDDLASETAPDAIRALFDIAPTLGKTTADALPPQPSAAWVERARQMNALFHQLTRNGQRNIPGDLWQSLLAETKIGGEPIAPGALSAISDRFAADNQALVAAHPALRAADLRPEPAQDHWREPGPGNGFRATQYLLAFMYRIDKATGEARKGTAPHPSKPENATGLSPAARAVLPPLAVQNFDKLRNSPYAPHNRLGAVNEEDLAAAYAPAPRRILPNGSSGRVIVGCMKNEAPYIVEWIAYHRAIGVDNFLIYTNDCTDGTDKILNRLQQLGIVQHRNNDKWRGKSPQQHALNMSRKEAVIRDAEWLIHIDVDEFINVRTGNGTLDDFFAAVPDATNVAMTWRLFGHDGVTRLADAFVIDQFERCAPKYCPKPHTAWGFKTMFKNIGAYGKISCHRPNKLDEDLRDQVRWVNGSGKDMTEEVANNGWRNSRRSIGYDLLQLNHYALRSAESFLIKRQRGRALHVDRSIGINYWIRMDWSDFRDITIKRNIPRVRAEYDRLMQDDTLRKWHEKGRDWHRAKAEELHENPEFRELYEQALAIKLSETERVAYALALDMES
ncbi:glycosyltransferase family 2 protein [Sedimentitalea todarodis]|uniref:Glycosyltransferase family 2 protein n=1 Tax=Sedimentitalea todarodis TaxID=1631240 RepID=A0ABU3VBC3_9RHOB|nr:glycosyltransferase family 2 protein [Sedimentitalea todarodis]MDU9003477.1 glycosyltransferase family 2 protein [Sedimentitalea todarodis]